MRPSHCTITADLVQRHAQARAQKYLKLSGRGQKCTTATLWAVLLWAAGRMRSVAAACRLLRKAPSDTAAHDALLAILPDYAELQRRLNCALQGNLPKALRRRRQPLAIDLKLVPYHGQPLHNDDEVYRSQARDGTSHFHAYATAYVIRKGQRFTVALCPVRKGQTLPEILRQLLRQAAKAAIRPRYLLLDRGFCSVA